MANILPGPWHLEYDGERDSYMVYDAPPNEDGEVFLTIAEVHVGERESSAWHQPSHARLIAAAPELLAALKDLREFVADNLFFGPEATRADQAIAKAEGRGE